MHNRVQVNVAGDTAIKVFGPISGIHASGNEYAGGPSDLQMGFEQVHPFWTGPTELAPFVPDGR